MTIVTFDLLAGTFIDEAAQKLVEEATKTFSVAKADFNGFHISAAPFSSPLKICKEYKAFCSRKSQEYQNSPEGKAQNAKLKEDNLAKLHAAPKEFSVEIVLSVITGRLLTKPGDGCTSNGIGALYDFIGHCLASDCFDIVSPRMADDLRPLLIKQFPELRIALEQEFHLERLLSRASSSPLAAIDFWIGTLDLPETYLVPVLVSGEEI